MRLSVAAVAACCAFAAMPAAAQKSFPYKARVITPDAYARSGPDEKYYPTEKLQAGAEVEVYRIDADGWYAIRPLPESFSWVPGRYLRPGKDGLAEAWTDRVAVRVGSQFSDIRDVVQVRLDRGEVVEIKGTKQVGVGDNAAIWYKIAPPAGEFRWIHAKSLEPDYPSDVAGKTASDEGPSPRRVATTGRAVGSTASNGKRPAEDDAGKSWTARPRPRADAEETPPAEDRVAAAPAQASGPPRLPSGSMRRVSPEEFQAELDDVNTELSTMLAEEPTVWNCDELRRRAESLLTQAETALERGRARVLVNRMAQAEGVKRRHEELAAMKAESGRNGPQLAEAGRIRSEVRDERPRDARFDGTGRLARVTPSKVGAPRYALVDDGGNIRYYVSPAPGVNMQYYLGREVGVSGQQGYITEGNAKHIMAKHVSSLDTQLR